MTQFVDLSDHSFEKEVLSSSVPVLVEFGAEWCGPCRQIEPLLEQLGLMWDGKVRLARVDIDRCIQLTQQFSVVSVPTLILFVRGEALKRTSGKPPRERMIELFSPHIQ